jgi:RNA polymerase primary sigma factor
MRSERVADPVAVASAVVDAVTAEERAAALRALLAGLTERERHVLTLRHGLGDREQHTLAQIGQALGCTRERARQIEAEAMAKLRERAEARRLAVSE